MIKYEDYDEDFKKLGVNINKEEAEIILDYINSIIEITIQSYNGQQK